MRAFINSSWAMAQRRLAPLAARLEPHLTRAAQWVQEHWAAYKGRVLANEQLTVDRQYLPAVIELQETPPSPTARLFLQGVCLFTIIGLLWSVVGTIDIIALGEGKILPTGRVKTIQPLEAAVIREIRVEDGTRVKAGDVLVVLDRTETEADRQRLREEVATLTADISRIGALLEGKPAPDFTDLPAHLRLRQEALYLEIKGKDAAERDALSQEVGQRKAEQADAEQQIHRLKKSVSLINERSERLGRLVKEGFYARNRYNVDESDRLRIQRELATQEQRLIQIRAAVVGAEQKLAATVAEQRRVLLADQAERETRLMALTQELAKAEQRNRQQTLTSPIEGTVQDVAIHTVGGVVTPAQELMKVVPLEGALEAEVLIPNKDVGFVKVGQDVSIKLEAFPFTKYGLLEGRVKSLALDAIQDERLGLVYKARIAMDKATISVGAHQVLLTPGLALTAEVKTGSRRIIEYFLSPIMQYTHEAIRER